MKDQVIKFLGDLPKSASEQFNQALELLRKSKNHDAGKVRYYNTLGLSPDRLESLLYDLKQLHSVTDIQLANARRKPKAEKSKVILIAGGSSSIDIEAFAKEVIAFDLSKASEEEISAAADQIIFVMCSGVVPEHRPFGVPDSVFIKEFQTVLSEVESVEELTALIEEIQKQSQEPENLLSNHPEGDPLGNLDNSSLEIDVKDPVEVKSEEKKEATAQEKPEAPDEEKKEAPVVEEKTEAPTQEKEEDQPVDPFKQKLDDFDLAAEKYNSIKSFAAEVSNAIGVDPADQKAATLKAFIEEAKKKFTQS